MSLETELRSGDGLPGMSFGVLRPLLDSGALSTTELCTALIERTARLGAVNAYASFDPDEVLAQARAADARRCAGERLPLLGMPISVKDNIAVKGRPCAAGTRALATLEATADALLIERLRAAGAVIMGTVGMHELALGITNNNAVTGPVRNPWDLRRIPGGSSGGSGASVAAGLAAASIGTDTGGSVRIPAALCGVVGFRPTVGRIPSRGIVPLSRTRDTAGPIALSVADCADLDAVLGGERPSAPARLRPGQLRLGIPRALFWDDLAPGVARLADDSLRTLSAAGVSLIPVSLPGLVEANAAAGVAIARYELMQDLSAYLQTLEPSITLPQLFAGVGSPDVARICASLLDGEAIPEARYREALAARVRMRAIYAAAFDASGVDALVFPTCPLTASEIGEDDQVELLGMPVSTFHTYVRNTHPGSTAGLPGVSLPMGFCDGLPMGLALDGRAGCDRALLEVASAVERCLPPIVTAPPL